MSSAEIQRDIDKLENNLNLYKQKITELEASIAETINLLKNNDDVDLSTKLDSRINTGKINTEGFYSGIERIIPVDILNAINNGNMIKIECDGIEYYVPYKGGVNIIDYSDYLQRNGICQNNVPGWDSNCDTLAKVMAIDLSGYTVDWLTVDNYGSVGATRYGDCHKFTNDQQNEYLEFIRSELAAGRVVTVQIDNDVDPITGKKSEGAHWVIIGGVTADVENDPGNLENYLILDPVDGKLKNWGSMNRDGEMNRGPRNLWVNTSNSEHRAQTDQRLASRVNAKNSIFHNG